MLMEAAKAWRINLSQSFMIGDRWTDIEAGLKAGCRTVLINASDRDRQRSQPHFIASSLNDATRWILDLNRNLISRAKSSTNLAIIT
jgi:FMN phosphatase YigB (HAD superfamily)